MVHASMRAVGPIDGGADALVDALETAVGPSGTILMNLGAVDDFDWVNDHPEEERAGLLRAAPPFDAAETPADPDVGVLAEVFRRRGGTMVSDHPDARFGASGAGAARLTDAVPWDDYYGPGSSLDRLVDAGGEVLRLGADIDTVTLLHLAEYTANVADKRRVRRHHKVLDGHGGTLVRAVDCLDDSNGIVTWPGEDYFGLVLLEYLATGAAATGVVGRASSELIDARNLLGFAVRWMERALS
ncbi:MAG: aminoglycoside N3-acetyltransferase [Ilumatobacteraceae bacterium]|nr:aminoglycoside N3-acetyltransferase [Ilumatobacteraceae bacterium]